ncbi:MAG: hypothetical protein FWF35_05745 [Elusimicrobia bacterium]|nr:hypothetical protein [Elusimicrobiota bacterium]
MKKIFIFLTLAVFALIALAQDSMRFISYYPTPYASYKNITANVVTVADKGPGTIKAAAYNIADMQVDANLDLQQSVPVNIQQVAVGSGNTGGTMTVRNTTGTGVLRLNQTVGNAAGVGGPLAGVLHLIDGLVMTDASGNKQLFPSPNAAKGSFFTPSDLTQPGLIWKPIKYFTTLNDTTSQPMQATFLAINDGGSTGVSPCSPACTGGQYCNDSVTPPACQCGSAYDGWDTVQLQCVNCASQGAVWNAQTQSCSTTLENDALALVKQVTAAQNDYYCNHGSFASTFAQMNLVLPGATAGTCSSTTCTTPNWTFIITGSVWYYTGSSSGLVIAYYNSLTSLTLVANAYTCEVQLGTTQEAANRQVCAALGTKVYTSGGYDIYKIDIGGPPDCTQQYNEALNILKQIKAAQDKYYCNHGNTFASNFAQLTADSGFVVPGMTSSGTCGYGGCSDAVTTPNWIYNLFPHVYIATTPGQQATGLAFYNVVNGQNYPSLAMITNAFVCFDANPPAANTQTCKDIGGTLATTQYSYNYFKISDGGAPECISSCPSGQIWNGTACVSPCASPSWVPSGNASACCPSTTNFYDGACKTCVSGSTPNAAKTGCTCSSGTWTAASNTCTSPCPTSPVAKYDPMYGYMSGVPTVWDAGQGKCVCKSTEVAVSYGGQNACCLAGYGYWTGGYCYPTTCTRNGDPVYNSSADSYSPGTVIGNPQCSCNAGEVRHLYAVVSTIYCCPSTYPNQQGPSYNCTK